MKPCTTKTATQIVCLLVIIIGVVTASEEKTLDEEPAKSFGLPFTNPGKTPSCDNFACPRTHVCRLRTVYCIRAPCPSQPECVKYDDLREELCTEAGCTSGPECTLSYESPGYWYATCNEECHLVCKPGEKCAVAGFPSKYQCIPDPNYDACQNVPCSPGFECQMVQETRCEGTRCGSPQPRCRPIANYNPCESLVCLDGEECIAVRRPPCGYSYDSQCPRVAKCIPIRITLTKQTKQTDLSKRVKTDKPCHLVDCRRGTYCVEVRNPYCSCGTENCRIAKCVPNRCQHRTCDNKSCPPGHYCDMTENPYCSVSNRRCCPEIATCINEDLQ